MHCETCGAPITEGRLCQSCNKNITDQLRVEAWEPKKEDAGKKKDDRMYIKDLLNKNQK